LNIVLNTLRLLLYHDLLNYRTELFKTDIFSKLTIWHWWQPAEFLKNWFL